MANNYSYATLSPTGVFLTPGQAAYLRATGAAFEFDETPPPLCLLADAANESATVVRRRYVFWEEFFNECPDEQELEDALVEAGADGADYRDRSLEDILREILLRPENAELEYLQIEGAHTCSKMRPGEFGGFTVVVTRKQYAWMNTSRVIIENGEIVFDKFGSVQNWED